MGYGTCWVPGRILTSMVDNLLHISRLEANELPIQKESCDINALVEKVLKEHELFIEERKCVWEFNDTLIEMEADPDLFSRVISNLASNACKFTSSEDGTIEIKAERNDGKVHIQVADNGPGIPEDARERIFQKFGQTESTRKGNSTGLGLTFCKLAVERHGGEIGVSNRPEGGSIFWFTLPG